MEVNVRYVKIKQKIILIGELVLMANKKKVQHVKSWENKYEKIEKIGGGGNATVYLVKCKADNVEYSLKELHSMTREKKARFSDEIETLNQHSQKTSGIIPICDYSKEDYWFTMPVATPIVNHIDNTRESIVLIVKGIIQIAETLILFHSMDISHRDIKPDNILFYNKQYCLGDFGLVDLPDSPSNFTRSDRGLGAIFTIAPEMKRNPKDADGTKADVFSLAKTLWILLTKNGKGFDGTYYFDNKDIGLSFSKELKKTHLVELEYLLQKSTEHNPDLRPNILVFKEQLEIWLEIHDNFQKSGDSQWNRLKTMLFGEHLPKSCSWENTNEIVKVLNTVTKFLTYNHMFLPGVGGSDFAQAQLAEESGFIYINDGAFTYLLKPKILYFQSFEVNNRWDYFLLELEEIQPIIIRANRSYEELFAYYDSISEIIEFEEYDGYKDSNKKRVFRYFEGKFLLTSKSGLYNRISATYDGRHNDTNPENFRKYIQNSANILQPYIEHFNNTYDGKNYNEDYKVFESWILNKLFRENPFEK